MMLREMSIIILMVIERNAIDVLIIVKNVRVKLFVVCVYRAIICMNNNVKITVLMGFM